MMLAFNPRFPSYNKRYNLSEWSQARALKEHQAATEHELHFMVESGTQHELLMVDESVGEQLEVRDEAVQPLTSMFYSVSLCFEYIYSS